MAKALILALLMLPLLSCQDSGTDKQLQELSRQMESLGVKAQEKIAQLGAGKDQVSEMTAEELAKLTAFEYKVVEFPNDAQSAAIEESLALLGKDRWECFQVLPFEKQIKAFCKRRPETYLRYIPRMFPF